MLENPLNLSDIAARDARPGQTYIRHCVTLCRNRVRSAWNDREKNYLLAVVQEICELLGHRLWEDGYAPGSDPNIIHDTAEYGTVTGLAVGLDAKRSETEHQRYYPLVAALRDALAREKALKASLQKLEHHPWWLLWKLITLPVRWPKRKPKGHVEADWPRDED